MSETRDLVIKWQQWHVLILPKRMFEIGWSDEKMYRGCNKEEGTEKHGLYQWRS